MQRVFALRIVAQVHREVARFTVCLKGPDRVPSMRVKITENLQPGVHGEFTAWGDLSARELSPKGPHGFVADGKTIEDALLNFLTKFEEQMDEMRIAYGRRLEESDYVWREPGEF